MNDTFYHNLSNGLKIVHRPTTSPIVYVGIMIGAGTRHEKPEHNGMAHYVEHCVFKGTQQYSSRQIIRHMEDIGGEINAYTTKEETTYYAATLRQHFRTTLHLLADLVLHPVFPEKETKKELSVILDEIESYNDSPSELIYDDFEHQIFEGSSLAMPILGTKKTLRKLSSSPRYALDWRRAHYTPERMVLFVYGNISTKQLLAAAEREFLNAEQPSSPLLIKEQTATSLASYQASHVAFHRHTHQTHLIIGARAYEIGHPKHLVAYLLNNILGGGSLSSRLNLALREKYGLVYNVESQITPLSDCGYWSIYLACEPHQKDMCLELCMKELEKLRNTQLTSSQLNRALRQLKGQMAVAAENQENNALAMAKQMLYYQHAPLWQETFEKISRITASQLQEVASELYQPENISTLMYD
jgi:predicted Zn-dependent peptidase